MHDVHGNVPHRKTKRVLRPATPPISLGAPDWHSRPRADDPDNLRHRSLAIPHRNRRTLSGVVTQAIWDRVDRRGFGQKLGWPGFWCKARAGTVPKASDPRVLRFPAETC
jgi:hypothetical protein